MEIPKEDLLQTCESLKKKGYDYLKKITAVDTGTTLEVVYIISSVGNPNPNMPKQETLHVKLPYSSPSIQSVLNIYPSADWYERELSEMFGIAILGRDIARRLLLEEWNGKDPPLRKSFVWGKDYDRM
jgi:NADH-quinone oxidoreductase subunit C